ncbi:MAG TPA: helix-turn-helix domain-containing protein [Burkholderiaceae bacterium]|nr:helix-turn-helix domain-containing protein [Burkholderiaceae bacterium]
MGAVSCEGSGEGWKVVASEVFEALLEVSRAVRRERRKRLARLIGKAAPHKSPPRDEDRVDVRAVRSLTGLSQAKFAELLGIELATLRNWEQGRRAPTGPARALLRAIRNNPVEVVKALAR